MDHSNKEGFEGLMSSLNLDIAKYQIHDSLNYNQLSIIKDSIESQLSQLFEVLSSKYNADMNTSLLTPDGFPRSDIDVVNVRLIRVNIIRLRNDHKYLLSLLENKLIEQFQQQQSVQNPESVPKSNIPFAIIDEVIENSPAEASGLQKGDRIVMFDNNIHAGNHDKLSAVVRRVQTNIDQQLTIQVLRDGTQIQLHLTPTNKWEGKGVLGCKIMPL